MKDIITLADNDVSVQIRADGVEVEINGAEFQFRDAAQAAEWMEVIATQLIALARRARKEVQE